MCAGGEVGSGTTLTEALARLVRAEAMSGYCCEACGRTCDAHKRLSLRSLPPVLVIHAKRFRHGNKARFLRTRDSCEMLSKWQHDALCARSCCALTVCQVAQQNARKA